MMNLNDLLGLPEDKAVSLAGEHGFDVRITRRDGNYIAVTRDYRTDRINLWIELGKVTSAHVG